MKKLGYILAVILLCAILISTAACAGSKQDAGSRLAQVTRGDLSEKVSGSGYIEIANEAELGFGTGGKIEKIYVKKGDIVKKGTVLAKLETEDMELAISQAENGQNQAELAVSQAEFSLSQAKAAITPAEVAKVQAEVALEAAKFELDRMKDVKDIQDKIDEAENEQQIAELGLEGAIKADAANVDILSWSQQINSAKQKMVFYQQKLADLLAKDEYATLQVTEVKIKALQVQAAEQTVKQTTEAVAQTGINVEQAMRNIEFAKKSLKYATDAVAYAKKQLDKATFTAPFDGVIADVSADEGDVVPPPSVMSKTIIHLIDTSDLELKVDLDEIDIPSISLGQKANISVDALPELNLEGKVTYISPIPSPQSGVVLYRTTISFQPVSGPQLRAGMSATADIVLNEHNNVLIVPDRAIYKNSAGTPVVKVMVGEQEQEREVVTGISDGFDTEIISGLNEGETIVVQTTTQSSGGMGFFGQ